MALSLAQLLVPVTEQEALNTALAVLQSLGFQTTSWQDGSVQRTLVQLVARLHSQTSVVVGQIAAFGFNELATGDGLTLLSSSHYQNTRIGAVATVGQMRLTSTPTAPTHIIAASDLQVADSAVLGPTTRTYRNLTGGTLTPGGTLDLSFAAEVAGALSNIATAVPLFLWTPLVGVTVTNPAVGATGTWITTTGINQEIDNRLRARNVSKWATLSYAATDGNYKNWALEALTTVTRVLVRSNNPFGPGTIDVVCAQLTGGISAGQITTILNFINGTDGIGRRPLNDVVTVSSAAVLATTVSGTVTVAAAFQTSTTETLIRQTVQDYFNELAIGGTIIPPAVTGVAIFAEIIQRLMSLSGVITVALTTPTADIPLAYNQIIASATMTGLVAVYV